MNKERPTKLKMMPETGFIGAVVRRLRLARGMTIADLATASGLSAMEVEFVETGRRSPKSDTVERLAIGLGVLLIEIYAETHRLATRGVVILYTCCFAIGEPVMLECAA